jgi:hypothetical protein
MLPLAGAARRAGHEVILATGPDVAPGAQLHGFDVWPVGLSSDETVARYLERYPDSNDLPAAERLREVAPRMFVDIAARSRPDVLRERAADWKPDIVVHDQSEFAAPIVAAVLGIPTVVHSWARFRPAYRKSCFRIPGRGARRGDRRLPLIPPPAAPIPFRTAFGQCNGASRRLDDSCVSRIGAVHCSPARRHEVPLSRTEGSSGAVRTASGEAVHLRARARERGRHDSVPGPVR